MNKLSTKVLTVSDTYIKKREIYLRIPDTRLGLWLCPDGKQDRLAKKKFFLYIAHFPADYLTS